MSETLAWLSAALNRGWIYRDRIDAAAAGLTVSAYYAGRYRHSDPATWARRLAAGEIRLQEKVLTHDRPLACGDRLSWHRPPWREEAVPALGPCRYDDGDLYVLDKPSGLPVLPAGGWLEHTVLRLLEQRHQGDPAGIPRPVHRLGRFTTGLLVCARRARTRAWLSAALRESTNGGNDPAADPDDRPGVGEMACSGGPVRKLYRALLIPGALALAPGESLQISTPIGRRPHRRLGAIWCAAHEPLPGDLPAWSRLTLLQRRQEGDLVQVAIGSGRPHQIRIHCASVGAPLLGDPLYRAGGTADPDALPGDGGYRLQAWRLELQTPTGERLMLQVQQALGEEEKPGLRRPGDMLLQHDEQPLPACR